MNVWQKAIGLFITSHLRRRVAMGFIKGAEALGLSACSVSITRWANGTVTSQVRTTANIIEQFEPIMPARVNITSLPNWTLPIVADGRLETGDTVLGATIDVSFVLDTKSDDNTTDCQQWDRATGQWVHTSFSELAVALQGLPLHCCVRMMSLVATCRPGHCR